MVLDVSPKAKIQGDDIRGSPCPDDWSITANLFRRKMSIEKVPNNNRPMSRGLFHEATSVIRDRFTGKGGTGDR